MIVWLDRVHDLLLPFLAALAALLALLFAWLVTWRAALAVSDLRRRRIVARYQPDVNVLTGPALPREAMARLALTPRRHRAVIASLIIDALRVTTGEVVPRLRETIEALGLIRHWRAQLTDRRWWVRAEAAHALGLVRDPAALAALVAALDDGHEEVRAAAVDALGRLADPRSIPALLARLSDQSRHQRARMVEAVCRQGPAVVPHLLRHVESHPADTAMAIDVLGMTGATGALDRLLAWTSHEDASVRVAVLKAIGSIGLDDRSFYYALRALEDPDGEVRGMAARALGRSGREAAVPYLAEHLEDEWLVAAHAATGLRRLGRTGAEALKARAGTPGQAGDLARQMVWELTALRVGA
jgi:HEAT repeat protein